MESLRLIPPDQFGRLGLPERLRIEIQSRLAKKQGTKVPRAMQQHEPKSPAANPWEPLILAIREEIPVDETYRNTVEILKKVMDNLVEHPENEKFKAIRLSNEAISRTIGSSKSAISLLLLVRLYHNT